jgi:hypothetical protein
VPACLPVTLAGSSILPAIVESQYSNICVQSHETFITLPFFLELSKNQSKYSIAASRLLICSCDSSSSDSGKQLTLIGRVPSPSALIASSAGYPGKQKYQIWHCDRSVDWCSFKIKGVANSADSALVAFLMS